MNLQEYKKICSACDRILNLASNNDEIVAFPILHVIREHPEYLKMYDFIFPKSRNFKSKPFKLFRKLKFFSNFLFDSKIQKIPNYFDDESIKLIIVSHIHNPLQCINSNDASFGMLHNDLIESSNVKPIILLINHTNISSKKLQKNFNNNQIDRIVIPKSSGILNELGFLLKTLLSLKRFSKSVKNLNSIESSLVGIISNPRQLFQSLSILRIGFFVEILVKQYMPKFIITTYEGYASERLIFSSARSGNNKIVCFGYQHSILNKHHHSLTRNIHKKYNPDYIFCCGDVTNNILKDYSALDGVKTAVLGSPNGVPINIKKDIVEHKNFLTFLFLPEGIQSEYEIFFNFIIECAAKFPNHNFVWRSHPSLHLESLSFFMNIQLPSNVIISKETFDDDLKYSSFAIYRGTTAIIRAVRANLIPIYLKIKGEIGIDILHSLNVIRVSSSSDLQFILKDSKSINNSEKNLKFCQEYFKPLDYRSIIHVINQYDAPKNVK